MKKVKVKHEISFNAPSASLEELENAISAARASGVPWNAQFEVANLREYSVGYGADITFKWETEKEY